MFCDRVGISKKETVIDMSILEECVRESLNTRSKRAFAVLRPIKVLIENWGDDEKLELQAPNHPQNPDMGTRPILFTKELYIDAADFAEEPVKGFHRLVPGGEVRLRYGFVIKCLSVEKNPSSGEVEQLVCQVDRDTLGKKPEGRKVKGVIHWLNAQDSIPATVRLYDRLFSESTPGRAGEDFLQSYNPSSVEVVSDARVERSIGEAEVLDTFQFERQGYFCVDSSSRAEKFVLNRTATLRDTWQSKTL